MLYKKSVKTCLFLSIILFNSGCVYNSKADIDEYTLLNIPLHKKIETKTGYYSPYPNHALETNRQTLGISPSLQAELTAVSNKGEDYRCTDLLICITKKKCAALEPYYYKKVSVDGYYIEKNDYDYDRDAFRKKPSSIIQYKGILYKKSCLRDEIFVVTSIKEIPEE